MDAALLGTLAAAAGLVALVVLVALLVVVSGSRRTRRELAATRADLAALRERLDRLSRNDQRSVVRPAEFVITDVGRAGIEPTEGVSGGRGRESPTMSSRQFASVALGESLVTLVSLGYGVRRALSAENRNRILFEMRREVKRSRKQRRRDLKEAKRTLRAEPGEEAA
jgi:hypothetical protein